MSMATTTYIARAYWYNAAEVTLQVDFDVLTVELATEINNFWGHPEYRPREENGDVQRTVVRMFGEAAIRHFIADGDASFGSTTDPYHTAAVIAAQGEGWPDAKALGILITAAEVPMVDYEDVELEVVQ